MSVSGKVCIVTGAGRGIGRAIAVRLCRAGARVLAVARTSSDLAETTALCAGNQTDHRCVALTADLSVPTQVEGSIDRCLETFGWLDVLVNNAGVAPLSTIEEMSAAAFNETMAVNVNAVFLACRKAWPALVRGQGTIINISSLAAVDPFPGFTVYGATKAWVNAFTRGLADEGRAHGIRAFALALGAVETPLLRSLFPGFPADRTLPPDDVAGVVEWLIDERCGCATGQTICLKR